MTIALAVKILFVSAVFGVVAQAQRHQQPQAQPQAQPRPLPEQRTANLSVEEYIIQNRRQYAAVIAGYNADLAAYNLNYEQRVALLEIQRDLLIEKLSETNARLNPLEVLNEQSKLCVRTYRNRIESIDSVTTAYARCISNARNFHNLYSVTATRNYLQNYYNNNLNTQLNNCTTTFASQTTNYTLCVTQVIAAANTFTINNKVTFDEQLHQARCNADIRIRQGLNCSFNTTYTVISGMGEALGLIERCRAEPTQCESCLTDDGNTHCPNVVNLSFRAVDFRNSSIVNPFFGLDRNAKCVLFNFNRPFALATSTPGAG